MDVNSTISDPPALEADAENDCEFSMTLVDKCDSGHYVFEFHPGLLDLYVLVAGSGLYGKNRLNQPRPLCVDVLRDSRCQISALAFSVDGMNTACRVIVDLPLRRGGVCRVSEKRCLRVKAGSPFEKKAMEFAQLIAMQIDEPGIFQAVVR